jgi:hypothetical protein
MQMNGVSMDTDERPIAWAVYGRVSGNIKRVIMDDEVEVEELSEFYDLKPLYERD